MDQDATWQRGRPRPRPHCIIWGSSGDPAPTAAPPHLRPFLLWPNGRPSQQLLSSLLFGRTVEKDVLAITDAAAETGLQLNQAKCEIILDDFTLISASSTFSQFIRTKNDEMLLLGAPVIKGKAQDTVIRQKIEELDRAVQRLSLLRAHDTLSLLKNSQSCSERRTAAAISCWTNLTTSFKQAYPRSST